MAGNNNGGGNGPSRAYFWTKLDNMMLENALILHAEETPNRWEVIARAMGAGRTAAEVRAQYRYMVDSGRIRPEDPAPAPADNASGSGSSSSSGSSSRG
ncbi:hypothetical protein QQ045_015048 [Rhodiola kirilowii]